MHIISEGCRRLGEVVPVPLHFGLACPLFRSALQKNLVLRDLENLGLL
jgi:hypothetical protein